MRRENPSRGGRLALLVGTMVVVIGGCGGGGGGGGSPTSPPPPMPNPAFGSFQLSGAGHDGVVSYSSGANLVFCRRGAGWADLWIRFAEQAAGNGENGPHLDIDLCNPGDGGAFTPMDPQAASCGGGKTWDIWWHGGGDTFFNAPNPQSCSLSLMRDGNLLTGAFSCRGLVELGGGRTLDVLDGSFRCSEE